MDNTEIVTKTIEDLKVGYKVALLVNNDILKDYVQNRMKSLEKNKAIYQNASTDTLVNSYLVDLSLFINICYAVNEVESRDYFKSRLIYIVRAFPELKNRGDLSNLL